MASVNISGTLEASLDGNAANGRLIKFMHTTNTGDVVAGFGDIIEIGEDGSYDFNINYGNVIIWTKDTVNRDWYNHGTFTINSDTPATTLSVLLGITTPATDPELLIFQELAADAADSAIAASVSATEAAASALELSSMCSEGTFVPTLTSGGTTITASLREGTYKIIGKLFFYQIGFYNSSALAMPSGAIKVGNMPFPTTARSTSDRLAVFAGLSTDVQVMGTILSGDSEFTLTVDTAGTELDGDDIGAASNTLISMSGYYMIA